MLKVSVIIPTYNEERYIGACLSSLTKQSLKNFEVIVVDDGSTDGTDKILTGFKNEDLKLKDKGPKIIIQKGTHRGAGAARNLGAARATGDILVFVDADMVFEKHFLKNLIKPIEGGFSKGTFSKDEYVGNWKNVWSRCWNINQGWEKKKRHPKKYPDKQKVFRAILKKEFDRVGGFTPGGYTDDYSLFEKLGYQAQVSTKAIFYHDNPESLGEVFVQSKWAAKRNYKFGVLGVFLALFRSGIPFSIFVGILKGIASGTPQFLIFKIIYDFGTFLGIIEYFIRKNPVR